VLEVLYHHAKFGWVRISPATGGPKNVEFFVCLSVCLFVTLLNVRVCAPCFAMKALEYRNNFDAIGSAKVCSRAPVFNFVRLMPTGDITKCRSLKNGNNWGFSPAEADGINRYRDEKNENKSRAVAEMGDRLATIGMSRKWRGAALGAGSPLGRHLTQCGLGRGLPLYQVAS